MKQPGCLRPAAHRAPDFVERVDRQVGPTSALKFIVVGTGRSATSYTAHLFTELGIPCGHEDFFNHHANTLENLNTPVSGIARELVIGECSWSAVPFLDEFEGKVFHQRREPLKVLNSWLENGLFSNSQVADFQASALEFIDRFFTREADPLKTVMRWIVEWNERCERYAHLSWNVESLDAETLVHATTLIGHRRGVDECAAVLTRLPKDINHYGIPPQLSWTDLPDSLHKNQLLELSRRYGYVSI